MARHRFTLAALATSAVPGFEVASAQAFTGGGHGDHDAALLTGRDGSHTVVRVPTSAQAARRLLGEVRALTALTAGTRSRLPFAVPVVRGTADPPPTVVTDYVPGSRLRLDAVTAGSRLAASIGQAIAAVHALPTGVVADAALPVAGAGDGVRQVAQVMDRAARTARVPAPLLDRWEAAIDDPSLWRYQPTVVHGSLGAESVLTASRGTPDDAVAGILGWADLQVADPAKDLAWVLGLPLEGATAAVFAAYSAARHGEVDRELRQRAMLHAELELARWLVYGVEADRSDVVEDATRMLATLHRRVQDDTAGSLEHKPLPTLSLDEVERMLDEQRQLVLEKTGPVPLPPTAPQRSRNSSAE
jgi:aminoglycoside phosphotransferase (APT) family kinase protein